MKYSTNLQSTFGKRQKNPQSALCHSTPQHDKCSRSDEKNSSKHLLFSTCQTGTALSKRRVRGIYLKNSIMLMQWAWHGYIRKYTPEGLNKSQKVFSFSPRLQKRPLIVYKLENLKEHWIICNLSTQPHWKDLRRTCSNTGGPGLVRFHLVPSMVQCSFKSSTIYSHVPNKRVLA